MIFSNAGLLFSESGLMFRALHKNTRNVIKTNLIIHYPLFIINYYSENTA